MRSRVQKIALAVVGSYAIIAGVSALYFNYQVAHTKGFAYWVTLGDFEATFKGALWPYFAWAIYQESVHPADMSLSDDEWGAIERVLPTVTKPSFTTADLDAARTVLDGFAARTGHKLRASVLERQFRFTQQILEWRAEASASIAASWDKVAVTKTPRYVELSDRLRNYSDLRDDIDFVDKILLAASRHMESMPFNGQSIPIHQLGLMEQPYREAAAAYDRALPDLADRLEK
jgi:hypothetical protein